MQALWDNPIVTRELRARMRGNRAAWLQLGYLGALGTVLLFAYALATRTPDLLVSGELGRRLFEVITVTQAVLICLIAPALSAGAISLEREQQTLDALFSTPMSTSRIFWGKLVAASLFLLLLLTIGLPLLAVTFLLGGVSLNDLVGTYAIHVCSALLIAAMGVGWSLNCQSTSAATVATYLSVGAYLFVSAGVMSMRELDCFGAAMPLMASENAGHTAAIGLPVWVGSALLTLLTTACLVDISACRARLIRDAHVAVRPRIWAWLVVAAAVAAGCICGPSQPDLASALSGFVLIGLVAAMVFVTGAEEPEARPAVRWWQFWRHGAASGALFALFVPVIPWLLYAWPKPEVCALGLVVLLSTTAGACAIATTMQRGLGKRWPAQIITISLLIGLHSVLAWAQDYHWMPNISPMDVKHFHELVPACLLLNGVLVLLAWLTRTRRR